MTYGIGVRPLHFILQMVCLSCFLRVTPDLMNIKFEFYTYKLYINGEMCGRISVVVCLPPKKRMLCRFDIISACCVLPAAPCSSACPSATGCAVIRHLAGINRILFLPFGASFKVYGLCSCLRTLLSRCLDPCSSSVVIPDIS